MARGPFTLQAINQSGAPAVGITATITTRPGGAAASVFAAETGGASQGNVLTTDSNGRAAGYLDEGRYRVTYTGGATEDLVVLPGVRAYARAERLTSWTLTNGGNWYEIPYDSLVDSSGDGWYSTTTGRFTPQVEGLYEVCAGLGWNAHTFATSSLCDLAIAKNYVSTTTPNVHTAGTRWYGNGAQVSPCLAVSALVWLNGTTDYLSAVALTTHTANTSTSTASHRTYLSVVKVA